MFTYANFSRIFSLFSWAPNSLSYPTFREDKRANTLARKTTSLLLAHCKVLILSISTCNFQHRCKTKSLHWGNLSQGLWLPETQRQNNDYITWMSMAVDQVCWTSSDIVKTPVEIARWTMSFSLTAQTSSTGRPILCTYRPAVDSNEKSQKYYALIASHADDFLGRNVCQSTKNICVRGECEVFLQVFVPNNRVLQGRGALLFGCIVFFLYIISAPHCLQKDPQCLIERGS